MHATLESSVIANCIGAMIFVGMRICVCLSMRVLKKSEESFQKMPDKFDTSLQFAHQAERKVKEVYGTLKWCSNHIDYINYSVMKENPVMMKDTYFGML